MNEDALEGSIPQSDDLVLSKSQQREEIDGSNNNAPQEEIDYLKFGQKVADEGQASRVLEELQDIKEAENVDIRRGQEKPSSLKVGAESEITPKFHTAILARGETGIDLGQYRDAIANLYGELFYYPQEELDEVKKTIDYSAANGWEAVVLALDGDHPIGFGTLRRLKEDNMVLDNAFVSPDFRKMGIYTKLIDERIDLAKSKGAKSVSLEALDSNVAIESLQKKGFKRKITSEAIDGVRYVKLF